MREKHYTYILYSAGLAQFYTGSAEDVEKRLAQHNSGKGKHTAKGVPWELVHREEYPIRQLAIKQESIIKKRGAKRYLNDKGIAVG